MGKKLVAFFSVTGCTRKVAESIAEIVNASITEIRPAQPYTEEDIDWRNPNSRSSVEMNDPSSRPAIDFALDSLSEYDTVFLGFPIWWYTAPKIVLTFLEKYDFSGKRIVVFATSGSSGFGKTIEDLMPSVSGNTIIEMAEVYHHMPSKGNSNPGWGHTKAKKKAKGNFIFEPSDNRRIGKDGMFCPAFFFR